MLIHYYINKIYCKELGNSIIYKYCIVDTIEMLRVFMVAILIKGILLF